MTRALLLLVVLLLTPLDAGAGLALIDDGGEQTLVSRGRLKIVPTRSDEPVMVLDMRRARMWVADPGRRVFWEGTVEEYCVAVRGMPDGMADVERQMRERMPGLPPAEREQMQRMLETMENIRRESPPPAPARPPRVTVERAGPDETVAGVPTRRYRVLADGRLYEELWLTSEAAFVRELDLNRVPDTFGRVLACLVDANARKAAGESVEDSAEYRALYTRGWPLRSVYHSGGNGVGRSTVVTVEHRDIPEAEFLPPAAFRRAALAEVFAGGRR